MCKAVNTITAVGGTLCTVRRVILTTWVSEVASAISSVSCMKKMETRSWSVLPKVTQPVSGGMTKSRVCVCKKQEPKPSFMQNKHSNPEFLAVFVFLIFFKWWRKAASFFLPSSNFLPSPYYEEKPLTSPEIQVKENIYIKTTHFLETRNAKSKAHFDSESPEEYSEGD